jgi:hypothetical protein
MRSGNNYTMRICDLLLLHCHSREDGLGTYLEWERQEMHIVFWMPSFIL